MVLIDFMHLQDGHRSALHAAATEKQRAILAEYTSDNCVLRPHLCPDGFTLAFYTKIRPPTGVTRKPTVKGFRSSNLFSFSKGGREIVTDHYKS